MHSKGVLSLPSIATASAIVIYWYLFRKRKFQSTLNADSPSASSSSTAYSVVPAGPFEVFLNFYGNDTNMGFTDFLYTSLVDAGIKTYRDVDDLPVGEEIGHELLKCIRTSKISIPIFSENYAFSKWCLLELEQMVECRQSMGQMIFPIFYNVDPADVWKQRGSYDKAFRQHKKKFDIYTERWRDALRTVGMLKGFELKKETNGHEGELIQMVVKKVLSELKKYFCHVPEGLVGMDKHIEKVMGLLELDSEDVRIVVILGMGGLGKTTIAKVIFNQLVKRFEGGCFLDDVRENSKHPNGITDLQNKLLFSIPDSGFWSSSSDVNDGKDKIKDAVYRKKLLLVLDNVDDNFQVDALMGDPSCFSPQSRVILTTRNKNVLDIDKLTYQSEEPCALYRSYKPDLMDDHHSLQLFSKYAFKGESPMEGYEILSKEVVSIAAGLPLALEVLGSAFFGLENKDSWEDKLRQLIARPYKKILMQLKFSFDALVDEEKEIFLDIACLFLGKDTTYPKYMWESCGFDWRSGIDSLVSRSLITVGSDGVAMMHDLLRDLGRQIVCEQGLNVPGKQSRLWREVEAMQVLESCEETSSVEGLRLDSIVPLTAKHFHGLSRLRYLNMRVNDVSGDFKHLLPNLKWLHCICSGNFSIINLNMSKLVVLDLSSSKLTKDWEGWSQLKMAKELKVLDLSCCYSISLLPDLSMLGSLEILKLRCCKLLRRLDGLQELKSLRHLDTSFCYDLERLPDLSNLTKLVELKLCSCDKLIEIQGLEKLESLQVLDISSCHSLETLPDISHLKNLKRFEACDCCKFIQMKGMQT